MKITLLVLILAVLAGASLAQEPAMPPCADWRAFDPVQEPTTLLGETQRHRLINTALLWVRVYHVDTAFDGVDLDELRRAYTSRIESARYDHEVIALLREMLAWVDADFTSREELERQTALEAGLASYSGIGILFRFLSDGHVLGIDYVFPGSPAEAAGLARGDRIIGVDQHTACLQPNFILGPAGTDVTLTVTSPGQAPRRIAITRAHIERNIRPRALRLAEPGIGYLWPGDFGAPGHPAAIRAALDDLGAFGTTDPLEGLVLDLRGGAGVHLNNVISLASLFTDGTLVHLMRRSGPETIEAMAHPERLEDVALVILVDAATGGFYGIPAAALQSRKRALVVGEPVRDGWRLYRSEQLVDGSLVEVPSLDIALPDGTRLRRSGLRPDSVMAVDWRDYPEHADPYIAEAIRLIRTAGIGPD
jgi:carboxyl-terminal processing protease